MSYFNYNFNKKIYNLINILFIYFIIHYYFFLFIYYIRKTLNSIISNIIIDFIHMTFLLIIIMEKSNI